MRSMLRRIVCGGPIKTICGGAKRLMGRHARVVAALVIIALLFASLPTSGATEELRKHRGTPAIVQPLFVSQLYHQLGKTLASMSEWMASYVDRNSSSVRSSYQPVAAYLTPAPPFIDPPGSLSVTNATSLAINLSWNAPVGGADHYIVERSESIFGPFSFVANVTGTTHGDSSVTNLHAYLYRVRAVSSAGAISMPGNMALGTAISFEFQQLVNHEIRAQHFYDVRTAINLVRPLANLSPRVWDRGNLAGLGVKADDVTEMRTALDAALTALSIPVTPYQDPSLSVGANGTPIKAIHIEQLQLRSTRGSSTSSGPLDSDSSSARLDPLNETGGGGENPLSRNFNWTLPLISLPGRAGMNLGLNLAYNSLVWTKSGNVISFDKDNGFPGPGFRLGFPVIQDLYFNSEVGKNAYLLIDSDGSRIELRQVQSSVLYESADSSHMLLDSSSMILRTADGTKMTYVLKGVEYKCTELKDRNGNYITISYTAAGQINTITDTLGRIFTFNYDNGWLTSITQIWNQSSTPVTHYWARFDYTNVPIDINFPGLGVAGPTDGSTPKMLSQVKLADDSHFDFSYTSWGQVWKVTSSAPDNSVLNYRSYDLPKTGALAHDNCPRFTVRYDWARYWNGDTNGSATASEEAATTFIIPTSDNWTMPNGSAETGVRAQVETPDGTVNKIYFIGVAGTATGWRRGLPALVDTYGGAGPPKRRMATTWTQDNTSISYSSNPRLEETNVYDAANNGARTQITYQQFTFANNTSCFLPRDVYEYRDASTILRSTRTDYNTSSTYTNLRILGLVSQKRVYKGDVNNGGVLLSNEEYIYDESPSIQGNDAPVQHDNSYNSTFIAGRGNVTSVKRNNVQTSQATISSTRYNTAGSVVSLKDALNHEVTMSYGDSFSDNVSRNTLAFATIVNDPDSYSSTWKYNFDFGAVTRRQTPKPNVITNDPGPEQSFTYDSLGRLERITNLVNNAYKRFVYFQDYTHFETYTTLQQGQGEVKSFSILDGAGRSIGTASTFPDSYGGYSGQQIIYDVMGRTFKTSNPTDTSAIGLPWEWIPTGDAWYFIEQTYDWKGRPLSTKNTDGTTKEATYSGCGCAGGEVITLKDEGTMVNGVLRKRTQKLYSDALGRLFKTELMKWDETTVDSAYVTVYDGLDRTVAERQYKDGAPAGAELEEASCPSGTCLQTTSTYDGYGRLKTRHRPEQQVDSANSASTDHTTWDYRDDDTVEKVTDARGAVINYSYNNRHLVNGLSYSLLPGAPTSGTKAILPTPAASFIYDAAGNRTKMYDGSGYVDYGYDQLSRRTSETRYFNLSTRSYTLTYEYNLVNDLISLTDSRGGTVNYGRDSAAQLRSITGTGTKIPVYASSMTYRAWGGLKHITYGNNMTYDVDYNARMKPTSFHVDGGNTFFGPWTTMNGTFEYYNDGRVKSASDLVDHNFDRAFSYDHVGRMENGFTNQQARDFLAGQTPSTTDQGPYRQTFSYDFHGNVTQRMARYWSQPQETINFSFDGTSNRVIDAATQYDAEGHAVLADSQPYKYDVAGQLVQAGFDSMLYERDGDGQIVQRVERSFGHDMRRHYEVNSSVLSGKIVLEDVRITFWSDQTIIFADWALFRSVYADGELIAKEDADGDPYYSNFAHRNPVTGSTRSSNSANVDIREFPEESDPAGISVGIEDPVVNQPPADDAGAPAVRDFEVNQQCAINGIRFDCSTPLLNNAGSMFLCTGDDCSGVRWNPNVSTGRGQQGAWEFFYVLNNGYSGWMTPYGFSHYEGNRSFYNSAYEDHWEKKTYLTRVGDNFSNYSITIAQGPQTPTQPTPPPCNVQIPNDDRSKIFVALALTESTMADYKNNVLTFEQFTKDMADNSKITFTGQQAEDELANELYYMASAVINAMAEGRYKTLEDYAKSESVGYANEGQARNSQLAYPVYCLKARLMLEKLAYVDQHGAAKDENGNPIRYWRGVDQGTKRPFRKGDVRAGNTDFMYLPPQIGKPNPAYTSLPYWKNGQWNEVKQPKPKKKKK